MITTTPGTSAAMDEWEPSRVLSGDMLLFSDSTGDDVDAENDNGFKSFQLELAKYLEYFDPGN